MEDAAYREMYEAEERHWWFRGRWKVIEALLARAALPARPRILDAGCGTGLNLSRYARIGDAVGIDPSAAAVRFCHDRGLAGARQAGLEQLPFEDASFDLIAATDVLEHVEDDAGAAREMRRVIAPGGALLLTVPAYTWMWSEEDEHLHHFRRYTRPRLRTALEAGGWRVETDTHFNLALLPAIALARKLPSRGRSSEVNSTPAWLDGPLLLPMATEAGLIRRGARLPAGVSIAAVCRAG